MNAIDKTQVPPLERFAAEAARAARLASVTAAREEVGRTGYLTAADLMARVELRLDRRPSTGA